MPTDPLDELRAVDLPVRARAEFTRELGGRLRFEISLLAANTSEAAATEVEVVRSIASALPGAEEHVKPGWRLPSWRAGSEGFVGFRDDGSLVVWVGSEEEKAALIASNADAFFTTPHYDGYPIVLVRVAAVTVERLRDLVVGSWRLKAPRSIVTAWDARTYQPSGWQDTE